MDRINNDNGTSYNGDLITAYYDKVPSLYASSSKVMIALSAVAIVGCHLHYAKYRFMSPYMYLHLTSLACLLQAGLQARVSAMDFTTTTTTTLAIATASQFFGLTFPPLAWCAALDAFRLSQGSRAPVRAHRITLAFCYFWTLMMIGGAIVCVSIYNFETDSASSNAKAAAFNRLSEWVTYGLWVFVVLFILLSYIGWTRIKHFYKSLAVYVVLLILVNVGRTTSLAILLQQISGHHPSPSADIATAFKIDFALSKIMGILAIYWAILFCHRWRTVINDDDGAVIHNQEIVSVITGDTAQGGLEIEHVVLDTDGGGSSKGLGWSKLQISRTTTNEQDNVSFKTILESPGASSGSAGSAKSIKVMKEGQTEGMNSASLA